MCRKGQCFSQCRISEGIEGAGVGNTHPDFSHILSQQTTALRNHTALIWEKETTLTLAAQVTHLSQ